MLVSLSWLREFVPYEGSAQELGDRLTMLGLELEGISRPFAAIEPIITGHVLECSKHPEADKLSVCRVDVGTEVLDIVCGAPNVAAGQKVAVVKVGSTLPNGLLIKAAKLRGMPSNGMICSEAELGLSDDHDGIMVLDAATPVGKKLVDVLKLNDEVLEISITPNRGDCLSILGFARETAVAFNLPLTLPKSTVQEFGGDISKEISINITDKNLSPLYLARVLENATIQKSPAWLRYRLHSVGVRAISNIVDVTNYILMELGQPLHAFDLNALTGNTVFVEAATEGERFATLDGQERLLKAGDITIRDSKGGIALGGVMGGLNTEITATTQNILLEGAIFNPLAIRRTARRLGLQSDASYRFERGVDQCNTLYATNRAAMLMAELSGAKVRLGLAKAEPSPWQAPKVRLREARSNALLGITLDTDFCTTTLCNLGCKVEKTAQDEQGLKLWDITTPSHRPDLTREADLIEELVRVYGVDKVPAVVPQIVRPMERAGQPKSAHLFRFDIKHWASGLGLNEAINYSFVSHKDLDHLSLPTSERISIMNPLSDEQNVLRTEILTGLFHNLRTNISQGARGIRLFEIANSFTADTSSETTAKETARLGILLYGNRFDAHWPQAQADLDYQDIKGIVEHLLVKLSLPKASFVLTNSPWLAPCVEVSVDGRVIGTIGKLKPSLADAFHAKKEVWTADLNLDTLYKMHLEAKVLFANLPSFPPIRRDITFIAPYGVKVEDILANIAAQKISLLDSFELIDLFEPKDKEERNLTYRLTFRHLERTLKDAEVDKLRDNIVQAVSSALGVRV